MSSHTFRGRAVAALGFLTLLACATAVDALDTADYSWSAGIRLEDSAAGLVRAPIPFEVFDRSLPTLDDLRVLDDAGNVTPHTVVWGRLPHERATIPKPAKMLNRTFEPGEWSRVTLDFGESRLKNELHVSLSGENFRREAMIEGSNDAVEWERVADGLWLLGISQDGSQYWANTLQFSQNQFRYLRLTVYNMPGETKRIDIKQVDSAMVVAPPPNEFEERKTPRTSLEKGEKTRESIYEFDLGFRNLPAVLVRFEVSEPLFHRAYRLFGRNDADETFETRTETGTRRVEREAPWRLIAQGILYRTRGEDGSSREQAVQTKGAPYRYLQLRVRDDDDAPLDITSVTATLRRTSVVFQSEPDRSYRLIGGNPKAVPAQFDFARAVGDAVRGDLPTATLDAIEVTEREPPIAPWSERYRILLWAAMLLATGVVLWLVLTSLRGIGPPPAKEE